MRNSLRSCIKGLNSGNDTILNAVYSSTQEGAFDVENVLLYNVGSNGFGHLCNNGLHFERRMVLPPEVQIELMKTPMHYHLYSVVTKDTKFNYWKKGKNLACWADIPCIPLRGEIKPHSIWCAMKNGFVEVNDDHYSPSLYGVQIKVKAPFGTKINLAAIVKPVLDGIISSFHTHNGSDIIEISERLAKILGENKQGVEKMLMDTQMNTLGTRNLLHKFGQNIQWNPADDTCVTADILFDNSIDGGWSLSGELFKVEKSDIPRFD
jgi:hypothetical protein